MVMPNSWFSLTLPLTREALDMSAPTIMISCFTTGPESTELRLGQRLCVHDSNVSLVYGRYFVRAIENLTNKVYNSLKNFLINFMCVFYLHVCL